MSGAEPAAVRRAFVAERRTASVHRFDTLHSPHYDEHWGTVNPSHAAFVARLTAGARPAGDVLDAACGTGKYWPALLEDGGYHYYPPMDKVCGWLTAAGFAVADEQHADGYWHFLLTRP